MLPTMHNNLKKFRKNRGLTLEQLAEKLNTSPGQLQRLESGNRRLNTHWLESLARFYNVKPSDLIDDVGETGDKPSLPQNTLVDCEVIEKAATEVLLAVASARATLHPEIIAGLIAETAQTLQDTPNLSAAEVKKTVATLVTFSKNRLSETSKVADDTLRAIWPGPGEE